MMILTSFIATYACIISSLRSSCPCRSTFTAERMLPYHSHLAMEVRSFGGKLEPRYIFGATSLDQ
jgi:hypothetical protein